MVAAEAQQRLHEKETELSKVAPAAQAQDVLLHSLQDTYKSTVEQLRKADANLLCARCGEMCLVHHYYLLAVCQVRRNVFSSSLLLTCCVPGAESARAREGGRERESMCVYLLCARGHPELHMSMFVRACLRAFVRVGVRACVRACGRWCVCAVVTAKQ